MSVKPARWSFPSVLAPRLERGDACEFTIDKAKVSGRRKKPGLNSCSQISSYL